MGGSKSNRSNARILKALSLLYLGLVAASLLLVHRPSYEPGVSFVLLYLVVAVAVAVAVALLLLPADQFTGGFCAAVYVFYAAFVALAIFFSGGVSSELHALYWPLLLAAALHGSWRIGLTALLSVLAGYVLAMLPAILGGAVDAEDPALIFFRLAALALTGLFVLAAARNLAGAVAADDGYSVDEDGSIFLEMVAGELETHRDVQVAVVLVDPGREVEDLELLLERVRARVGEPVLLGEGSVFGVILSRLDERGVEGAARRALAAASSLGSEETRAGAAIYPHDARTAGDLLAAAGQALEAAFEIESPSAIVLAGQGAAGSEGSYRAAR
ncbi:MAG: hypothetical protein H0U04_05820 [Rubrobacter sp.]|nr:hypothetical protein [Rubrobacter sp.]